MGSRGPRRIFVTGAAGTWGLATARELAGREGEFQVVALVRPAEVRTRAGRELRRLPNVRVVAGDVTDPGVVGPCVAEADVVLHLAAVVSPRADDDPDLAWTVNVGGAETIVRAVRSRPDPGSCAVVMVGSCAEVGDRNPPRHWGRVGDPVRVSEYDEYGQSKVAAERVLVESGLPRWAWLRQTGIFSPGVLRVRDAIMTHVPLDGVMEWVTEEDSARLLAGLAGADVPSEVWGRVHNVGGGREWRLTNWEFLVRTMGAMGVGDPRTHYDRNWFATRNFHGQWYTDSDRLDELVPFRRDTVDAALARAVAATPSLRMAGVLPASVIRRFVVAPLTRQPRGTQSWFASGDEERIRAFYGSREQYAAIGDWSTFTPVEPSREPVLLDHGYDESKDPADWDEVDLKGAAAFRGGRLLSSTAGSPATPVGWACADGHEFEASPRLILHAGHWCPVCVRRSADYGAQAEANEFLAQVV